MAAAKSVWDLSNEIQTIECDLSNIDQIIDVVKHDLLDGPVDSRSYSRAQIVDFLDRPYALLCGAAALLREIHKEMKRISGDDTES